MTVLQVSILWRDFIGTQATGRQVVNEALCCWIASTDVQWMSFPMNNVWSDNWAKIFPLLIWCNVIGDRYQVIAYYVFVFVTWTWGWRQPCWQLGHIYYCDQMGIAGDQHYKYFQTSFRFRITLWNQWPRTRSNRHPTIFNILFIRVMLTINRQSIAYNILCYWPS